MDNTDSISLLNKVCQIIYDKKGFNILALDVREISSITDYFIIAEGNVDRHVQAIAKALVAELGEMGVTPLHVEGESSGDWVVLDYLNFIIHLFMPGLREKYQLEELWQKASVVDVEILV